MSPHNRGAIITAMAQDLVSYWSTLADSNSCGFFAGSQADADTFMNSMNTIYQQWQNTYSGYEKTMGCGPVFITNDPCATCMQAVELGMMKGVIPGPSALGVFMEEE